MPRALIIGASGQDGTYLAKFLLEQGYEVFGTSRNAEAAGEELKRLQIRNEVALVSLNISAISAVVGVLETVRPDEVYNLSGPSSVGLSFEQPIETMEQITIGALNLLEAIRHTDISIKLYNSASSECFGETSRENPGTESSAFNPKSPYGVAKAAAYWLTANYRSSFDLFACSGILFNHESPLRARSFVTRKVICAAIRIAAGSKERLLLGRLDIVRDWGWAPEYVEAMWRMLQSTEPKDYVVATGKSETLENFVAEAFSSLGLDWREHVEIDPTLFRPDEVTASYGDSSAARRELDWVPKITMPSLVRYLLEGELERQPGAGLLLRQRHKVD